MKRIILLVCSFAIIAVLLFSWKYSEYKKNNNELGKFNKIFLEYNKENILGTDLTTIINKAMDNNRKNNVPIDENGYYINDDNYCIKIYISLKKDDKKYEMEKIYKVGVQDFTKYFGELKFKCSKLNYHNNGRVSEMYFEPM